MRLLYTGSTYLRMTLFKVREITTRKRVLQFGTNSMLAQINATTWNDRTNYFEVVPSEHLEKATSIEADRMRYSFIKDEDRQPEMTVVRNNERGENSPFDVLDKNVWATAIRLTLSSLNIGWRSDIESVSTERLKEFYDVYYWPNNATATVIGDFDKEKH